MGAGAKVDVAFYVKRLFDAQLAKADPKKDSAGRLAEAVMKMDARLGPEWRGCMIAAEIDIIPVTSFMDRVNKMADEEGIPRPSAAIPGRIAD